MHTFFFKALDLLNAHKKPKDSRDRLLGVDYLSDMRYQNGEVTNEYTKKSLET